MKTLVVLILTSILALSNAKADCDSTLKKCAQVVKDAAQVIADQDKQIGNYKTVVGQQQTAINDANHRLANPLRDPVKVTVGTGILIGGAMVAGVAAAPAVAVGVGIGAAVSALFGGD